MKKLMLALAVILSFVLAAGCGGNGEATDSNENTETAAGGDSGDTEEIPLSDPDEFGQAVFEINEELFAELNETLSLGMPAEELVPVVAEIKERYITMYVELGEIRESMTDEEKDAANSAIRSALYDRDMEAYRSVNEMTEAYRDQDNALANELVSLSILMQYADFELLRSQEPGEVERLGL